MTGNPELEMPAAEAAAALLALQPSAELGVTEEAAWFAQYLAERYIGSGQDGTTTPELLVKDAEMALDDLRNGRYGVTNEPLEGHPLVDRQEVTYVALNLGVAGLVRAALPEQFADGVDEELQRLDNLSAAARLTSAEEFYDEAPEGELITEPITIAEEAFRQILGGANKAVLALDWESILPDCLPNQELAARVFQRFAEAVRARPDLAIQVLMDVPDLGADELENLSAFQKYHVAEDLWLAVPRLPVDPITATAIKDLLFQGGLDAVCQAHGLMGDTAIEALQAVDRDDLVLERSVNRIMEYVVLHPDGAALFVS